MKKVVNQHGDVILEAVKAIPEGAKQLKVVSGFVLEKGEGIHTHILKSKKVITCAKEVPLNLKDSNEDFEVWQINDDMYIKVKNGKQVILDHEEHGKQILTPGIYKKNIEREYSYEDNEERRVID
jgi:hypothetical protein